MRIRQMVLSTGVLGLPGFVVTDRAGLVAALDGGSATPKIIKIDANSDADGDHPSRTDHTTDGYDRDNHLAAHDLRAWGCAKPSGCHSGGERDRTADVGRTPTLHAEIDNADAAHRPVARGAGAGRLP